MLNLKQPLSVPRRAVAAQALCAEPNQLSRDCGTNSAKDYANVCALTVLSMP
ncbi:hypothetical protein MesoLj113b_12190 [Mesorhizobium sp. 113-3-3]|nr:hypothetical protein MesoLj113b_12190 [Mesorhizobium sp. 113-3-3]